MAQPISDVLDRFEAALALRPADYATLIGDLDVPARVTSSELTRLYAVCFSNLQIETGGPKGDLGSDLSEWQAAHLTACARGEIERTMFDANASKRTGIAAKRYPETSTTTSCPSS